MTNISLTFRCNLHCPYCFAHELRESERNDISLENFDVALAFATKARPAHIGLIGGEPTLHARFDEIVRRTVENSRVTGVTLFTNGLLLDRFAGILEHPKVSILVNFNHPDQLGGAAYERTRCGVDELVLGHGMARRVNLGLNIHDGLTDYGYMLDLLQRYNMHSLRISLSVPPFPEGCSTDVLAYFRARKPLLWQLFHDLDDIGVLPYYDCNRPPWCIWDDGEKAWLAEYVARYPGQSASLIDQKSSCSATVDILPDLRAVRCFGMSFFEKVPIADFANTDELTAHFMRLIDRRAYRISADQSCKNCHLRRTWRCCQGCMGFKAEAIARAIDKEQEVE